MFGRTIYSDGHHVLLPSNLEPFEDKWENYFVAVAEEGAGCAHPEKKVTGEAANTKV